MPEAVAIMAQVAAGGDRGKLEKMMEQGQVDAFKYLPLFFEELGRRAQPNLEAFFATIQVSRGRAAKANEDFMKAFFPAGGSAGIKLIFDTWAKIMRDSTDNASYFGDVFYRIASGLSAVMLVPGEFSQWWRGKEGPENIFKTLFGEAREIGWMKDLETMFSTYTESFKKNYVYWMGFLNTSPTMKKFADILGEVVGAMARILTFLFELTTARSFSEAGEMFKAFNRKEVARQQANQMADSIEAEEAAAGNTNFKVPYSIRQKYAKIIEEQIIREEEAIAEKQHPASMTSREWLPINAVNTAEGSIPIIEKINSQGINSVVKLPEYPTPTYNSSGNPIPSIIPSNAPSLVSTGTGQRGNPIIMNEFSIEFGDINGDVDMPVFREAVISAIDEATNRMMGTMLPNFPNTVQ